MLIVDASQGMLTPKAYQQAKTLLLTSAVAGAGHCHDATHRLRHGFAYVRLDGCDGYTLYC